MNELKDDGKHSSLAFDKQKESLLPLDISVFLNRENSRGHLTMCCHNPSIRRFKS